jgi:Undecaprenyl-phosphate glucose phosphotransferase
MPAALSVLPQSGPLIMSNSVIAESWPPTRTSRSIFQYVPYRRIGLFTGICDLALVLSAAIVAGIVYNFVFWGIRTDGVADVALGTYSAFTFILVSKLLGLYQPNTLLSANAQIRGVVIAWGAVLLVVTSVFFLLKSGQHYSRGATIGFGVLGLGVILTSRALTRINLQRALANGTLAGQRVIVIGDPEELAAKPALHLLRTYGAREVRRFELPPTRHAVRSAISNDDIAVEDIAILNLSIAAAQIDHAEQVLLALRWSDTRRRQLICERLRTLPLSVLLLPDQSVSSVLPSASNHEWLSAIEIQRAPLSWQNLFIKRIFDLALASIMLVVLSPLLLTTGLAIKLDSAGPIIFRQRRRGFSGREFAIYKFRTMTVLEDGPFIQQAQREDRRVTRIGRLLRISSIDELPQLINVIIGKMSLVGPRPHALAHDEEYSRSIDNYAFRRYVKPGMTGWAQTHGFRGETPEIAAMHKRIQFDLWYINNWNLWLDCQILALTCVQLLRPWNAY